MTRSERFEQQLRRAYHLGRARWALWRALPVASFGLLLAVSGRGFAEASGAGALLVATTWLAGFRSRPGLYGALAGVSLGAAPLVVNLLLPSAWHLSMGSVGGCLAPCALACVLVGAGVGGWLTTRVSRLAFGRRDCVLALTTTALVSTAVGCQVFGIGTALGALLGVAFGASVGQVAVRRYA